MALRARVLGLAARAVEQCLNSDPSDGQDPVWPCHCGQTARRAGRRAKTVVTALGPLRLERAYYHCSACASGFFPRDRLLGPEADSLSPAVHRMNGVAAAHSSFGEASDLLHELAGLSLNPKRSERAAKALGLQIRQDEQEVVDPPQEAAPTLYLGMDGTGVPVRASEREGRRGKQPDGSARTREAKLVTVWSAETRTPDQPPERDPDSVSVTAAIETAASRDTDPQLSPFAQRVVREATRRGFDQAGRRVILGDGAAWIWNLAGECFPDAIEIVDLFHAKQHLWEVARSIYGPGTDLAAEWATRRCQDLDAGRIQALLTALDAQASHCDPARRCLNYISTNRERMRYDRFRAMGLCITSGVVEASCRTTVGLRLKRSGMHWTVEGANAILALRCAILSNRFDDFWERRPLAG